MKTQNFQINPFEYAVIGNALLGTRGAGKTHTGKFLAETLMDANIPVVIIDPVGKWRYMQDPNPKRNDGKGYSVIVVGKDGDVELSIETIEQVIRIALENRSSLVIDLFDKDVLEHKDEIVSKIVKLLLYENEPHGLRHIFFEEASEFVHQYGRKTESSVWIERLVRLSGNVKVGATFINQNSESLSKNVLKLCDGIVLGRQKEANSIKMVRKWMHGSGVENADEISESLPNLESGEFWIWSKSSDIPILTKIPDIKSSHPSRNDVSALDVLPATDMKDVLQEMKRIYDYQHIDIPIVFQREEIPEPEKILLDVTFDVSELSWLDRNIVHRAENTPYGNNTVRGWVDSLVADGYIFLDELGLSNSDDELVLLHNEIEFDYAKILLREIGLENAERSE